MNIKITNNIPNVNIKVTVTKDDNGENTILLTAESTQMLGDIQCGDTVKIGEREFIVLGHGIDTTAVLAKNSVKWMKFSGDGDWCNSDVREFCNGEFFNGLADTIGAENIIKHTVKLMADDGTGKELSCEDKVSILTTELYRRYREYMPVIRDSGWTATRVTHDKKTRYTRDVCCVDFDGVLVWGVCDYSRDVHPFCVLNSSILV